MINATTLLLVRHAETIDNVANKLSGWTDADLTPRGERQIQLLASHVNRAHRDAAALYASPLIRARRTAEAIGALTGHTPVFQDDLREMYFGDLDGRPFEELHAAYSHLLEADSNAELEDFVWPNGESRSGFVARIMRALDRIARAHVGQSAIVVSHGGVISTFLALLHRQHPAQWREWLVANCSLTEVAWDPHAGQGVLLRQGDDAHLAELAAEEAEASSGAPASGS